MVYTFLEREILSFLVEKIRVFWVSRGQPWIGEQFYRYGPILDNDQSALFLKRVYESGLFQVELKYEIDPVQTKTDRGLCPGANHITLRET